MNNLTELFQEHNIPLAPPGHRHVRTESGWIGVDCPNCSPTSNKFRLGFNVNSGAAVCWNCGKLDSVAVFATLARIEQRYAAKLLLGHRKPLGTVKNAPNGVLSLPSSGDLLPAHRQYLIKRGFDPDEIVETWGISGIGPVSKLAWRILIPIYDANGDLVSWTTRAIGKDAKPRYVSAGLDEESVNHKSLLYGSHLTRHSIVVCEGPISAWGIGPGAVAVLGVNYSQDQLNEIGRYPIRAICFDAVPDAQRRAEKLCRDLAALPGVTHNIRLDSGKDTGECSKWEITEIRKAFLN